MQTHDEEASAWQISPAATPQPPPIQGHTDITPLVIADLEARRLMGIAKYGTPLMVENGRDHAIDAYQEMLDMIVYAKCMLVKRDQLTQRLRAAIDALYHLQNPDVADIADTLAQIHREL